MKTSTSLYYKIMGNKKLHEFKLLQKLALIELRRMYQEPEYAKKVRFVKNAPCLLLAFKWRETISGFDTWKTVYNTLMSK